MCIRDSYNANTILLPPFHGIDTINESFNKSLRYALYHGDLSTSDNEKSVNYLINIFEELDCKLVIASNYLPISIENKIKRLDNIVFEFINNDEHLDKLIQLAQINVLFSFQKSGTKLKVFRALYRGKHCVINSNIVDDELIISLCHIANSPREFKNIIIELMLSLIHI